MRSARHGIVIAQFCPQAARPTKQRQGAAARAPGGARTRNRIGDAAALMHRATDAAVAGCAVAALTAAMDTLLSTVAAARAPSSGTLRRRQPR
jgi:hypothetical protein